MLQAHSFFWHYLWTAPNVYLLLLAFMSWKRGFRKQLPVFIAFAIFSALGQLAVYFADILPSVSAENFWRVDWASVLIESLLKFALIAEIFAHVFDPYASVAKLGKLLIRGVGASLVLAAALAAAYAPKDSPYGLINGAHLLEQTIYLIETGLLLFIFLFSAYFRLRPERPIFGIALGLAISACVHLATWAVAANVGLPAAKRVILDFVNMGTYHICVLIWCYYLLVQNIRTKPPKPPAMGPPPVGPFKEDLEDWNQELERLIHR